jgi:hypothetical protein
MRRVTFALFFTCVAAAAFAGGRHSQTYLRDIENGVQCFLNGLPRKYQSQKLIVFASQDEQSYRGEHHLWLFIKRPKQVFNVADFEIIRNKSVVYRIVNNANIRWDGRKVFETGALLGGLWTHSVMETNFARSLKSKPLTFRPNSVARRSVNCESFADAVGDH